MALQCGIVGLPNVGKSTMFNALTGGTNAEAANYRFCTIDPNVGVVTVPDPRMGQISEFVKPKKQVPTTIEFVDIAGLVEGASKGAGKGIDFLDDIRQVNAILHVVRCFEDPLITHEYGTIDPIRDMEIINTELMLADLAPIQKRIQRLEKQVKGSTDSKLKLEMALAEKVFKALDQGLPARTVVPSNDEESDLLKSFQLLTSKPVLYVCNVGEADFAGAGNEWVEKVKKRAREENNESIMICSVLEAEIAVLSPAEQSDFLSSMGATEPGLHRLIREAYKLLNLITYFTAGEKEVRAWTIRRGTKAPQAAGVIHSDFEKGFIRAETYNCEDLFRLKSEGAIKEAGLYRSEGKEYVVKDGDIMLFRFNV